MNKPLPNSPLDSLTEDVFVKGSNSESVPSAGTERTAPCPSDNSNASPSDVPSKPYVFLPWLTSAEAAYDVVVEGWDGRSQRKRRPRKHPNLVTPEGAYVSRGNEGKENPQVVPATEGNAPPRTQTKDPMYNAMEMDSDMSMSQHDVLTKCCGVGTRCQYEGTIDYCLECGKEGPEFLAEGEVYVDEGEGI